MKRKRVDWSRVTWTPFTESVIPGMPDAFKPDESFINSRYQVSVWYVDVEPFGRIAHLSIKTHDKQAHHDWRDLQRIKNELCGAECDAVEIYPAESKLVDTANQYHLFVFNSYKLPFGFQERMVGDGVWQNSRQRPFDVRPADCLSPEQYEQKLQEHLARTKEM